MVYLYSAITHYRHPLDLDVLGLSWLTLSEETSSLSLSLLLSIRLDGFAFVSDFGDLDAFVSLTNDHDEDEDKSNDFPWRWLRNGWLCSCLRKSVTVSARHVVAVTVSVTCLIYNQRQPYAHQVRFETVHKCLWVVFQFIMKMNFHVRL